MRPDRARTEKKKSALQYTKKFELEQGLDMLEGIYYCVILKCEISIFIIHM